jgi:hypothetical protein
MDIPLIEVQTIHDATPTLALLAAALFGFIPLVGIGVAFMISANREH